MYNFCSIPFNAVNIDNRGQVVPCLCEFWHTKGAVGSLIDNSLVEIVDNENFLDFKKSIIDQSFKYCHTSCSYRWNLQKVEQIPDFAFKESQLPDWILLKIDRNCNLKCASCRNKNIFSTEINPNAKIILDKLNTVYKEIEKPTILHIDGSGDVFASAAYLEFLNRPDLAECFRFFILTNGNLITKNLDLIKKIQSKIIWVEISFDAATPDTYKKVRGGKFENVIAGTKALIELGIPVITQYVVQQKNYQEIAGYIRLAKSLGVADGNIALKGIAQWGHMDLNWWINNRIEQNPAVDYDKLIQTLQEVHQDPGCRLDGVLLNLLPH
jgi:sulfatase maturation enzyme AslB (radical SAM superfamily)